MKTIRRLIESRITRLVAVAAFIFLLSGGAATVLHAKPATPARPNIVILLADDLGWGDVGFHGGVAETPNINRLAREGVQLQRFYAYPACSPARAAMLTGRFPHRYGIEGPVRPRDEGLPLSERLLVADFQEAGYQTALIGKWHLSHSTDMTRNPVRRGFDHFYGFLEASVDYYKHTDNRGNLDWQRNGTPVHEEGYATDLLANEAIKVLAKRDKRQPLCMVVSFNAPHTPFQAPQHLEAKYSHLSRQHATYAAMVDSLDQGIGRILAAIDQQGISNETIVVFASDNGAARMGSNAPLRGQKRQVNEGGIRVPCIVKTLGVTKPGTKSEQFMAIHDLLPTLAGATGVALKDGRPLDGVDLWDSLVGGDTINRTMVIAEADYAIYRDQWKLIQSDNGELELYDIISDPTEQHDLSSQRNAIVKQLAGELNTFKKRVAADQPFESQVDAQPAKLVTTDVDIQEGASLSNAELHGDVDFSVLGDRLVESNGRGIRLLSGEDRNGDGELAGEASIYRTDVAPDSRWYRFDITAMAQDGFEVNNDNLYLMVEFFQKAGTDSLDSIKSRIYPQVERERRDFRDESTNASLGHATWRTYAMDFRTPFAEVDMVKLSVGFNDGTGRGKKSEFWVQTISLRPIAAPADYQPPTAPRQFPQPDAESLVALGGRWYYDPQGGSKEVPKQFDYTNSDQLLYKSARFEAPFAGNMSSWLRAGYKDFAGDLVEKDEYKPYAVVIQVTDDHIVMRSRNLPNHPTATFPDKWRMLDGNPSYIQEKANTWYLPKYPKLAADPIAMDAKNSNGALPMGPIGVATNGVIFFNPFDHIFETDAVWRLDRCCGHPSPQSAYHYHKYPICVKTPWSDEGKMHSSVIGFAFDGIPVYGPYEADGLLAKDDTQNPLNDFNLHTDDERGPHYHVTPGQFPHIIGGYWGEVDPMNGRGRRAR
ncbi:sulfatase-like hydrolase/transferase [Rhodopirellula sallentina]|uniref:Arylsulfatase B n=1 Tax=Rhodopirellula sallentina SM41 TaxID=1263870 RepID=M5U5U0_9BACT|nr:sulfatase-like hydrolase/transferase [Rhodopirellula sallentina]EMI53206.1 arylsulfatase B [Rhodopirellula sallentina SM41]